MRTDVIDDGGGVDIRDVRYRALGPLAVEVEGRKLKLGGPRQQVVLAILLTRANHVVPQDALIEAAWSGKPPDTARATLQTYIYGLRKELGMDAIGRYGDGYRVEVTADSFDVVQFEQELGRGLGLVDDDPVAAQQVLSAALRLWYGNPYGGLDDTPAIAGETARLTELRLAAVGARIDAELACGNHLAVIGELETLVRDHPLRERFRAQQMLALYRSGRQADALRAYQQTRIQLAEELGIEPSEQLQDLEQQILDHAADLHLTGDRPARRTPSTQGVESNPAAVAAGSTMRAVRGYELRERLGSGDFGEVFRAFQPSVGREVTIKAIRPAYANHVEFVRLFEHEAQVLANLTHPHIVPLLDYWRDPEGAFLVTPIMRGGNLADATARGGWNLAPALRLLDQIGNALAYAHRHGVIHRDVKPGNVLFDDDGNAYLADFALAVRHTDPAGMPVTSSPAFVTPEETRGEPVTVRSDIYALGVLTFELLTGVVPSPQLPLPDLVDVRPGVPPELAAVVARATAADPADRFERVEDLLRAIRRSVGADVVAATADDATPAEPIRNPYKGLQAFGESDSFDFHGRAALIDDLLQTVASQTLTAVVGPSGSGKSSLVRAGLIPAIRAGGIPGSRHWLVTDMFPGSYPFEELEAALLRVAVDRPIGLLGTLLDDNGLLRVCKQILPGDDSTLLLIVDQFEELFSSVRSEQTRRLFLDNLTAVARDERSRVRVVLTLRADFLDRPLGYGEFAEVLGDGIVVVGPPTRDGLAQAVAAPARNVGVDLEPGLVGRVIADVENQPGGLPLLQYALTETFARRRSDRITIDDYEATGGVVGALGRRAEELYAGLSEAGKDAARQLFLRLVTVDETAIDSRRRARQSEMKTLSVDQEALDAVLHSFGQFRLLSFDRDPVTRGPTVEVAHEALLREWGRLADWIDAERESLVIARRLNSAARDWLEADRDPSFLLRGARLDQSLQWAATSDVALTVEEQSFLDASVARRTEERWQERRRRRRLIGLLSTSLIAVSIAAAVALVQRNVAEDEARHARIRELAVESLAAIEEDPELAMLIALEAIELSTRADEAPLPEAVGALHQSTQQTRLVRRIEFGDGAGISAIPALAAASDGRWLATSAPGGTVVVIDPGAGTRWQLAAPGPGLAPVALAFSPDSSYLAASYGTLSGATYGPASPSYPDIVVYEVDSGQAVAHLVVDGGAHSLDFSPDGTRLAVGSAESVSIQEWRTGRQIARVGSDLRPTTLTGNSAAPTHTFGIRFLGAGDAVAVAVTGVGLAVYSVDDGERLDLVEVEAMGTLLAGDPVRSRAAYIGGGRLHVYDWETGDTQTLGVADPLTLAWSTDGNHVAFAGFDSAIRIVDVDSGELTLELAGSRDNVFGLAYLDVNTLANAALDEILLWDVSPQGRPELGTIRPAIGPQWGYQISPDGTQMATFSLATASLELLDVDSGETIAILGNQTLGLDWGVRSASPDFTLVGSFDTDFRSTIRVLPTLEVIADMEPCRNPLAFTPDNTRVLVSGNICRGPEGSDSHGQVISLASGEIVLELPHRWIYSGHFNPEGRHPGGRYLAVTDQSVVDVYDVDNGEVLGQLTTTDLPGALLNLAFDPDGRYLAGGTTDGTVWVIDMDRLIAGSSAVNSLVFRQRAHTGAAPWPAITADGRLATAGFDGLIRLWDVHSGAMLVEFRAAVDIPVVAFSPDGSTLFYPDGGNIARFPLDPTELVDLARRLLTRDFTPDECARYRGAELCP